MASKSTNTRKCKLCGIDFIPKVFWQKFCCSAHQKLYWKKIQQEKYEMNRRLEDIEEKLGLK